MRAGRRWLVVGGVALALVLAPVAWAAWPADDGDIDAVALAERVRAAEDREWSGYLETRGTLQLPDADEFSEVASLFGEQTRMRVWWRSSDAWRVDRLLLTGQTSLIHRGSTTTRWSYERSEASIGVDPDIRLPRTVDLLPPELGRRALAGTGADELSRLPARRVAGRDGLGLRVRPADDRSSIDRVDLWADRATGVPLRVELHTDAESRPALLSVVEAFDAATPPRERVAFDLPSDAEREVDDVLDIADAANTYAPIEPPDTAAGLDRAEISDGAVGVYGRGLSQFIAIPLRERTAAPLREQLRRTIGVRETATGRTPSTVLTLGPLGILLTGAEDDGGWLVAGTVTAPTLITAGADLLAGARYVGDDG